MRTVARVLVVVLAAFVLPALSSLPAAALVRSVELVSVSSSGFHKSQNSMTPVISRSGRYVVFLSYADFDSMVNPNSPYPSLYLRDRVAGTTRLASLNFQGDAALGSMFASGVSDDGRFVLISGNANLVAPHDGRFHVYLRDMATGGMSRVDVSGAGTLANGDSYANGFASAMSPDGRFIAFASSATNLVPGDNNGMTDTFLRDSVAGTTRLVSVSSTGIQANYVSGAASVSDDGRFVAFDSPASNLVPNDTNAQCPGPCGFGSGGDVFLRDMVNATTDRVSLASDGTEGNDSGGRQSYHATISGDGRYVSFLSGATNLVSGDTNETYDGFLRDRLTSTTTRLSVASDGSQLPHGAQTVSIASDARYALVLVGDSTAAPGFPAGTHQAVRRDLVAGTNELAASDSQGNPLTAGSSEPGQLSGDGGIYVFTTGQALASTDQGTNQDVYVETLPTTPPPSVSVTGVSDGATYEFGAVPAATCSAVDAIDGTVTFNATLSAPSGPRTADGLGSVTASCAYTNSLGIAGSASVSYSVADTSGPSFSVPDSVRTEASAASTPVSFTVTAVDLVDGSRPVTCDHPTGSGFAVGATTITCASTDVAGNVASAAFVVTVVDTTGPVLVLPSSVTVTATTASGAAATYAAPTAVDAVDGSVPVACDHPSGAVFGMGSTVVACAATDAAGNTTSGSFTVHVQDRGAPVVTVPAALTIEASGPTGASAAFSGVSAVDDIDGAISVTCDPASGSVFALGTTSVTCTATDTAGNNGSSTFTITTVDTTAPAVTVPIQQTVEASGPLGATVIFPAATAHDAVDGLMTPTCTSSSGSQFGLGDTLVTCAATDAAGNTASGTFIVTVTDTTVPVVTVPPSVSEEATSPNGAHINYGNATAVDIVDGTTPVSCSPASGGMFGLGDSTITCTATDVHGNTGSGTFTVTVIDRTPPEVMGQRSPNPNAAGWNNTPITVTWTAYDIADGNLPAPASTTVGTDGIDQTATSLEVCDHAGNCAHGTVNGLRIDTTAPTVETPTWTINPKPASTPTTPTATTLSAATGDLISGVQGGEYFIGVDPGVGAGTAMEYTDGSLNAALGAQLPVGVYDIGVRAQDVAGNWSAVSTTMLVVYDAAAPGITGKNKKDLVPSLSAGDILPGLTTPGQTDTADYGFTVDYRNGAMDPRNDFHFSYSTGSRCNTPSPTNCHQMTLDATTFAWLVIDQTNSSRGRFQGMASVTVDGATTTNPFTVEGVDGDRLTPAANDHIIIRIYATNAAPSASAPIYQASGSIVKGNSVRIR